MNSAAGTEHADRAGEEAKRVIAAAQAEGRAPFMPPANGRTGGYQPYRNPEDQSIYLRGIS